MTPRGSLVRGAVRAVVFLVFNAAMIGAFLLVRRPRPHLADRLCQNWNRGACRIAGLRVRTLGTAHDGPTLFVVNHVSYLDIPALRSVVDARFVAKREVRSWPLFGLLARFDGSVFIGRTPADLRTAGAALRQQLAGGRSLVLFPEGTSSDGSRVLPFKSSLFEVLRGEDETPEMTVQPVSLVYLRMRGGPLLDAETRPLFAWFGDMDLLPHIWRVFRLRGVEVVVSFREPLDPRAFGSRKELAARAHWEVSAGLEEMRRAPLAPRRRPRWRRARAA